MSSFNDIPVEEWNNSHVTEWMKSIKCEILIYMLDSNHYMTGKLLLQMTDYEYEKYIPIIGYRLQFKKEVDKLKQKSE